MPRVLAAAAFAILTAAAPAEARTLEPFTVVNSSGYTITQLFVRLDGMGWSQNWLRYQIRPNEDRDFSFTSGKSCTGKIWIRTLQRAEFTLNIDFCYEMTFYLTNEGLEVEY